MKTTNRNQGRSSRVSMCHHILSMYPKLGLTATVNDHEDDPDYNINNLSSSKLLEIWRKGQRHTEECYKIWKNDYLLNLRERSQIYNKHPGERSQIYNKQQREGSQIYNKHQREHSQIYNKHQREGNQIYNKHQREHSQIYNKHQ